MLTPATWKQFQSISASIIVAGAIIFSMDAPAQTALADQPLLTGVAVPGNLLLSLSVEYPTALSWAYPPSGTLGSPYTSAGTFIGYFDPAKCYIYVATPVDDTTGMGYFQPYSMAVNHSCSSSASSPLWSGNWLNWVSMQTIDTFRWALTGGYRSYDSPSITILERAWASGQGGSGEAVNKSIINASDIAAATPFSGWTNVSSRSWGAGNQILVSGTTNPDSVTAVNANGGNQTPLRLSGTTPYTGQNSYNKSAVSTAVYALDLRVKVCDKTVSLESNCVQYASGFKPEGLLQKYSQKIRFGVFGYLNDPSINRDGGVLRANMKFIAPTVPPLPGATDKTGKLFAAQVAQTNTNAEWDSKTGVMINNPNPADATNSGVSNSGVINYLNKFGQSAQYYKTYDPVSELYYAGIRYYKNLGNWSTYTDNANTAMIDGFPVITAWQDPILYSCQKNFILGIGDNNTHADANLPGSKIGNVNYEKASRPTDTTVDVKVATDMVGTLEGISNLGSTLTGNYTSYFMAGLAYDSHTKDMRPNDWLNTDGTTPKYYPQTISTYWVDVWENQVYANNNKYYLATKYGGFSVPKDFQPYASTNTTNTLTIGSKTTAMTNAMWHTNSDKFGTNPRPDNLFSGAQADVMVAGLNSAFASIISNITGSGTTFSTTSGRVGSSNNLSYATQYNSGNWTGDVLASTITYDSAGTPTFTQIWSAQSILATQANRNIVTCCTSKGAAFPFQKASFNTNNPTNYATFANVSGVDPASQSADKYLAYLRGVRTGEIGQVDSSQVAGVYRTRAAVLGDIVNAKLLPVGPPGEQYAESYNAGYSAFKALYANRKTIVYAGSNDGMMHAFDGTATTAPKDTGGQELFAYVPSFVYGTASTAPVSGLASLGNPTFTHHYFVDGPQQVFDIDLTNTYQSTGTKPNWKSVLIGGLGKGGKGYYAIDVTDPSTWTSESTVAGKVLWEFTDSRMGYSYGPPAVVKTAKYGWVIVFTSGYNNSDGKGYFFFVNPATGALLEAVATGVGSVTQPAGLAYVSAYVGSFLDYTADAIYAGDLLGNIWRIDVTSNSSANYPAPLKFATLTDSNTLAQPVTTRPLIEIDPNTNKRYVLIGTGALLGTQDLSSTQKQTFYAIPDGTDTTFSTSASLPTGISFPITRSNMAQNTNLISGIGSNPSNPMGWYFDLTTNTLGVAARIVVTPSSSAGLVAFATVTPNGDPCNPSSSGLTYAVAMGTGKTALKDATGATITSISTGAVSDLQFLNIGNHLRLLIGGTTGVTPVPTDFSNSTSIKRVNWRELPTAD
ncbi:pilus assembly protein [Undibacterium sp. Dicai25W]|uniref:pilus assembly protein n=1 Tax=Undibacterium sp. Dicai25W TaxID=3413034 RepID=UPI003BF3E983